MVTGVEMRDDVSLFSKVGRPVVQIQGNAVLEYQPQSSTMYAFVGMNSSISLALKSRPGGSD